MRRNRTLIWLGLAAVLLSPAPALAGFTLTVNPERLNGTFDFDDQVEGTNNTLEFELEGRSNGFEGQVQGNAGSDLVTISYTTDFPEKSSLATQKASIKQGSQVRVRLVVDFADALATDYVGEAAPSRCTATAKIRDNQPGDPDDPDSAQATLRCALGRDWQEFDTDNDPSSPGDPPPAALDAVEAAFDSRRDVRVATSRGQLQIRHRGEAAEPL
jgi:hypothetical protein